MGDNLRNNNGDEYYATNEYAKTENGDFSYAKTRDGSELYLNIGGFDVMAQKKDSKGKLVYYFAFDKNKIPICPLLKVDMKYLELNIPYPVKDGVEIYPKRENREYYIGSKNALKYAKDAENNEYYAKDNNKNYYAFKENDQTQLIEFPAEDKSKKLIYIEEGDKLIYPININLNLPIYPVDSSKNEVYVKKLNKEFYGCNKTSFPYYAKKSTNDEYFANNNNIDYYAFYKLNNKIHEYYPKLKNRKEFYLKKDNKSIYAKDLDKHERYAKNEKKDDILADDKGLNYYATNETNIEYYPSYHTNRNFYRSQDDVEKIAINKMSKKGFYAKNEIKDEIYPKKFKEQIKPINIAVELNIVENPSEEDILKHLN